jgi:hypothetical protein
MFLDYMHHSIMPFIGLFELCLISIFILNYGPVHLQIRSGLAQFKINYMASFYEKYSKQQ